MIRTQIQLTKEQMDTLRHLAARKQVSIAKLIRQGVDRVIQEQVGVSLSERRRRALSIIGRFAAPGLSLSEDHDKYFAEEHDK